MTATRTPTRADELVSDTVVIERATDRTAGQPHAARAAGARRRRADLVQRRRRARASSVFIRGAEARHTILLIDGVRYGSATAGTPGWDNIPLDMIDRIEVVKGPASALYGSDGVGGVVQIFTRKARAGEPASARARRARIGSEGYKQITGGFTGAQGAFSYSLDAQRTIDRGFSATNSKVPFGNYNPDRDPFSAERAQRVARLPDQPRLEDRRRPAVLPTALNHYDDGPDRDTRGRRAHRHRARRRARGRDCRTGPRSCATRRSRDYARAIVAAPFNLPGLFETTQDQYLWQNDIDTPIGTVVAGLERREQTVDSDTRYTVTERAIDSAFVGLNGSAGAHSWQLDARHDRNSQFGDSNTWFAGYGYRITPNWRVQRVARHQLRRAVVQPAVLSELRQPGAAARGRHEHRCRASPGARTARA